MSSLGSKSDEQDVENRYSHIVVAPVAAWGHTKSACAFLCKLVRKRNIYASFLVAICYYEKVIEEIRLRFVPGTEDDLKAMIRIIGVEGAPLPANMSSLMKNLNATFKKLAFGEPVENFPGSKKLFPDVGPPKLLLLDNFLYDTLIEVKRLTNRKVPVYAITSTVAVATFLHFGPERLNGHGDLFPKLKALEHLDEKERNKEAQKAYENVKNELLRLPGLPPMFDYEHYPQKKVFESSIAYISAFCHRFFLECDGIVLNTSLQLEGPAIGAWKDWFGQRPVICPGPFDHPIIEREPGLSGDSARAIDFLDSALERHGPNSAIYISFGSLFWSTEPEKIWAALDVIIEKGIPFVFAHASPFATVPQDMVDKIKGCGFGFESNWLSQTEILNHKATGWFVSHCGHNSVLEALSAGVPIIAWPFEADQPCNAAYISSIHSLGYELFEIRSGYGMLPVARLGNRAPIATVEAARTEFRDVLEKAMGEDGKQKRENACRFSETISDGWKPNGASWKELDRMASALMAPN